MEEEITQSATLIHDSSYVGPILGNQIFRFEIMVNAVAVVVLLVPPGEYG